MLLPELNVKSRFAILAQCLNDYGNSVLFACVSSNAIADCNCGRLVDKSERLTG